MHYSADAITALEKRFWDAHVDGNVKFFDERLADDCVVIAGFGFADKRTIIRSVALQAIRFAAYTMHDVTVLPLGADAASISHRCVIQAAVQGQPHTIVVNTTTVWVRDVSDDIWRVKLHQQTPAAQH